MPRLVMEGRNNNNNNNNSNNYNNNNNSNNNNNNKPFCFPRFASVNDAQGMRELLTTKEESVRGNNR